MGQLTNLDLCLAIDDAAEGNFGFFHAPSLSEYVMDPRHQTLWDLKIVFGRMLEVNGFEVSSYGGSKSLNSNALKDKVRAEIADLILVSFPDPKRRRLGVLRDDTTLPEAEWPEAKLEIGPALKVEVPKINVTSLGVPYFMSQVKVFLRNPRVVELAKLRAKGLCEHCGCKAPFQTTVGQPYLEVHHVVPLAKNGPDTLQNVLALCPNCHREAHFGANGLT